MALSKAYLDFKSAVALIPDAAYELPYEGEKEKNKSLKGVTYMKKSICFIFVLAVLLSVLTACNFTTNISGALESKAESAPKVEEMLEALTENRSSDAQNLMHPHIAEESDEDISQMIAYLEGCDIISMELDGVNISTSTGTSGKSRQEQIAYRVTLDDNDVIYINAVYLSDNAGTGFTSFQLVLGVI